jgi:hypothetical protein
MSQKINDHLVRHVSAYVGRLQVTLKRNEVFIFYDAVMSAKKTVNNV